MKLYLPDAEEIYFPQIKEYFREIVSSYDNGNYRSAMVMLYSAIVCDLLLKLRELADVYSDTKAEDILKYIEEKKSDPNKSIWEWEAIKKIKNETELLDDQSFAMIQHIYDFRNMSAHPAMTDEYELISPSPEIVVAYIKMALESVFTKPPIFAKRIVDRMSDDIAAKKSIYKDNEDMLEKYLEGVYFQRMSDKMACQVFRAFWKFAFVKTEEAIYSDNRHINCMLLKIMLKKYGTKLCDFVCENQDKFVVAQESICLYYVCLLCGYFPKVYESLNEDTKYQISCYEEHGVQIIKWFTKDSIQAHMSEITNNFSDAEKDILSVLRVICIMQGAKKLFVKFILNCYLKSDTYIVGKNRFDNMIRPHLDLFDKNDLVELIEIINQNDQIYNYGGQIDRNDIIIGVASSLLPDGFDYTQYRHFHFSQRAPEDGAVDDEFMESL